MSSEIVKAFYKTYAPLALEMEKKYGIPAVFALSQSALETGYATAKPGNMMFGIKASSGWMGKIQKQLTWECGMTGDPKADRIFDEVIAIYPPGDPKGFASCKGKYSYRVRSKFRAYDSARDSFEDWVSFLSKNANYRKAIGLKDPVSFAHAVASGGYATATNYLSVLTPIMNMMDEIKKKDSQGMQEG